MLGNTIHNRISRSRVLHHCDVFLVYLPLPGETKLGSAGKHPDKGSLGQGGRMISPRLESHGSRFSLLCFRHSFVLTCLRKFNR